MSLAYTLAYRLGITPWEKAAEGGREQLAALFDREAAAAQPELGRALDLGCGLGLHSIELARRGWQVTGIDLIPRAIAGAQARAEAAGSAARFVVGDVTAMPGQVGAGYRFALDLGCYQGLSAASRARFWPQVTGVTQPGAILLLLAFAPGGRLSIPRGAARAELEGAHPNWRVLDVQAALTTGMPGPMARRSPQFYRLLRT